MEQQNNITEDKKTQTQTISKPQGVVQVQQKLVVNKQISTENNINKSEMKENNKDTLTEEEAKKKFLELVKNNSDDSGKTLMEKGRELLGISSMANLMLSDEFINDYQEVQKKQIIDDLKNQGKLDAIKNSAKRQENRNIRNNAFYNAFKPFFENFMGIKESFGLIPMLVTVIIFYIPYLLISLCMTIVEYTFKGVNKIFAAIIEFKKPAKHLCSIILWLSISIVIILALIYGIQALFHFKII